VHETSQVGDQYEDLFLVAGHYLIFAVISFVRFLTVNRKPNVSIVIVPLCVELDADTAASSSLKFRSIADRNSVKILTLLELFVTALKMNWPHSSLRSKDVFPVRSLHLLDTRCSSILSSLYLCVIQSQNRNSIRKSLNGLQMPTVLPLLSCFYLERKLENRLYNRCPKTMIVDNIFILCAQGKATLFAKPSIYEMKYNTFVGFSFSTYTFKNNQNKLESKPR
jgi:hypothetical protein